MQADGLSATEALNLWLFGRSRSARLREALLARDRVTKNIYETQIMIDITTVLTYLNNFPFLLTPCMRDYSHTSPPSPSGLALRQIAR